MGLTTKTERANPLRETRLRLGLTQKEVARRMRGLGVQITAQTVYHWEKANARVPASYLPQLDQALDLPPGTMYREFYENGYYRDGGAE